MSSPVFRFRQFEVWHDRCAMKVGTDGVLLGAWSAIENSRRILDIGTGSGLVALMAAQRATEARIVAVEIDEDACRQARENVGRSPFAERIEVLQGDIRNFQSEELFDSILCNPPFFTEDTLPDDPQRALARNSSLLRFDELIMAATRLLSTDGVFHVVLPYLLSNKFENQAFINGLKLKRKCLVRTVERKTPKRVLLSFSRSGEICFVPEKLILQYSDGGRSRAYADLTKDFYLF